MHIVTWNVNSINCRLNHLFSLIDRFAPEVILLQEIKIQTERFPYSPIEDKGYNCAVYGQKSYNGVAVLSKSPISNIKTEFCDQDNSEARYIECITDKIRIASVYVPNGREVDTVYYEQKLNFLRLLSEYLQREQHPDECFIIGGDFNVALNDNDVWDPKAFKDKLLFTDAERAALKQIEEIGFTDAFTAHSSGANNEGFTWWNYQAGSFRKNHGIRLDYLFLSSYLSKRPSYFEILKNFRGEPRPSDHAPVIIEIDI